MIELLPATWPAPRHVMAFVTTRKEGVSQAAYARGNLATHVGDDPHSVSRNRQQLITGMPGCNALQWLDQTHSTKVHAVSSASGPLSGDGLYTQTSGLGCAVLTADCLPVLLTDAEGTEVSAVHAGWRGLADGILRVAVERFRAEPAKMIAWLGPAISQAHFEVGEDVARQLTNTVSEEREVAEPLVIPIRSNQGKAMVDLYAIARYQLIELGIRGVYGGDLCTFGDVQRFYSYRRDGTTGRMASVIYLGAS